MNIVTVGRRKTAVARVFLSDGGAGTVMVNGKTVQEYFPLETMQAEVMAPLVLLSKAGAVTIKSTVKGGGLTGQAGALRHAIARALDKLNDDAHTPLKLAGFLTRDPRMKERKKYGLKAARRAPQFSKR